MRSFERSDVARSHDFSLTLDDKAGKWYRTLKPEEKRNMANFKDEFILAFAKQGPKWGLASQLHLAKRKNGESMWDFIYQLNHLNSRCQPVKRFRNDQLLDRCINGMNHKELYNSMIMQGITTLDNTIARVIQLEDNLEMKDSVNTPSTASATKSTKDDASPPIEQVVARYLQRMGYVNRNQPQGEPTQELVYCSIFHGEHPTRECPTLRPVYKP